MADVLFSSRVCGGAWWICPALISLLFIAWGFWTPRSAANVFFTPRSLTVFLAGAGLGLAAFLEPAVAVLITGGIAELSGVHPGSFSWWLFIPGYLLMALGLGITLYYGRP